MKIHLQLKLLQYYKGSTDKSTKSTFFAIPESTKLAN